MKDPGVNVDQHNHPPAPGQYAAERGQGGRGRRGVEVTHGQRCVEGDFKRQEDSKRRSEHVFLCAGKAVPTLPRAI
jgi:hypothetical protein